MLEQIKIYAGLAIVVLLCYGTWYATSDHYQRIIAENAVKADKAVRDQMERNQKLMADLAEQRRAAEEKHAKDQLAIDDLAGKLGRVYVHIPGCGTVPATGQTGTGADGGGGVLPATVDGLFGRLQERVSALVLRCDQLNIDAIKLNEQVK